MAQQCMMVKDIKEVAFGWTVQVLAIEKGLQRLTTNQKIYQKVMLIDSEVKWFTSRGVKRAGSARARHI